MRQCEHCPWRLDVDPHEIPDGYSVEKHQALASTIAEPGAIRLGGTLSLMACHESSVGQERPCVGYLANQLGPGNNIGLRLWARKNLREPLELVGDQHECFEDTLPDS